MTTTTDPDLVRPTSAPRPLRDVPTAPPSHPAGPADTGPTDSGAPTPAPAPVLPVGVTPYHHFLRTPGVSRWRGVLAVLATVLSFGVLQALGILALIVVQLVTGWELLRLDQTAMVMTPGVLLATNVSIGLMIPASMLIQRVVFGQRVRWLHSVHGRFRWRLALRLAAVLLPIWAVYAAVLTVAFPEAAGASGPAPTVVSTLTMLAVVVLTTPLQAAGEEYATRGLLARSFGSWFASPRTALVAALVGPNLLFMVAHGAADWTLALYYLVFGLGCSIITWRTGGLEAAVVLHAINNLVVFAAAAFLTSEVVVDRSAGTGGAMMLIPATMITLATAGVWLWTRRRRVARAADPVTVTG